MLDASIIQQAAARLDAFVAVVGIEKRGEAFHAADRNAAVHVVDGIHRSVAQRRQPRERGWVGPAARLPHQEGEERDVNRLRSVQIVDCHDGPKGTRSLPTWK